jgi:hypothetical protein
MGRKKKDNVILYMRVPRERLEELKELLKLKLKQ